MNRSIIRLCIIASLALGLIFPQKGVAGVASTAIRDTTEAVMRKFGKEVAEESAEAVSKRVAEASAKYGTEGLEAIGKVGPRAFGKITVDAGEHASEAVKLTAKFGDQAVWVISKPRGLAVFVKYGEDAATAVMKHPGVAEGAVERLGVPAARALNSVGSAEARRLGMMIEDGAIKSGEPSAGLLGVVGKYGDEAMKFIWKHKGALAVGATLTAFLHDPEPYLRGAKELIVEPIVSPIVRAVNWTLLALALLFILAFPRILRAWRNRNLKSNHGESATQTPTQS